MYVAADRPDRRRLPQPQDGDDVQRRPRAEGRRQRAGACASSRPSKAASSWSRPTPSSAAPTTSPCATKWSTPARAPVAPQLYLQLVRDGNKLPGESSFYSDLHRPGGLHRSQEIPEGRFQRHRQEQGRYREDVDQRLRGDGAALLRQRLDPAGRHQARAVRAQGRQQPVRGRHDRAAGADRARRQPRPWTPSSSPARRTKTCWSRSRPAWTWSRTTAGSPSWPSRCTGCWTSCTASSATGAGPSWRWC